LARLRQAERPHQEDRQMWQSSCGFEGLLDILAYKYGWYVTA